MIVVSMIGSEDIPEVTNARVGPTYAERTRNESCTRKTAHFAGKPLPTRCPLVRLAVDTDAVVASATTAR